MELVAYSVFTAIGFILGQKFFRYKQKSMKMLIKFPKNDGDKIRVEDIREISLVLSEPVVFMSMNIIDNYGEIMYTEEFPLFDKLNL